MSGKIKVLITDDHNILREGLISLIEKQPDVTVVGEAEDAGQCLAKAEKLKPDVVVMDIKMAGASGIDACRHMKAGFPDIKVIMLSMYDDYEYVDRALRAGADGYLLKKVVSSELVDAIRKAARGERVFSPQILEMIVGSLRDGPGSRHDSSPLNSLTDREREVLRLASDGLRNKQIAAHLFLSPKTVEKVVSDIYRKLGVNSRVAAIRMFLQEGNRPAAT